ncbi:hypothetical protein L1987_01522 [Smallanthus sonchifolius]|uniref:Uncharacterized protein n=1 Tax=Smallanthus sonchifolius TaxID=185202 RepID=A0ACB9K5B3_9ASTR|nr:hypothetical protein L1987_01522 [Smallanthus sonchifolius]
MSIDFAQEVRNLGSLGMVRLEPVLRKRERDEHGRAVVVPAGEGRSTRLRTQVTSEVFAGMSGTRKERFMTVTPVTSDNSPDDATAG